MNHSGYELTFGLIRSGRHASEAKEEFREERGIGKVHLMGYLRCRFICVTQFNFDACDECAVYPVLGSGTAGLAYNSAQVALSETHAVGIIAYLVMLGTMLGDQL